MPLRRGPSKAVINVPRFMYGAYHHDHHHRCDDHHRIVMMMMMIMIMITHGRLTMAGRPRRAPPRPRAPVAEAPTRLAGMPVSRPPRAPRSSAPLLPRQ
eukprot:scaffold377_cov563-Prasinococcus_capsulatus_cf.AAC.29